MPRYEFREDADTDDWVDQGSRLLNLVVRVIGLVLLGTGFIVALLVIASAWSLYENPARIEAFAIEVERGSNLDLTLSSAVSHGRAQVEEATAVDPELVAPASAAPPAPAFRFSYFVAWMLAILLLLLIGRLAIAAVRTGGELALYDVKVGKLARALLKERLRAS
ncbi:MAG: hypothetical protein AB7Q81_01785 [Gammaproteobacteria bacterium]